MKQLDTLIQWVAVCTFKVGLQSTNKHKEEDYRYWLK